MRPLALLLLLVCGPIHLASTARILAYLPVTAPSHHFFFQPFLFKLAESGHYVDYYSPIPMRVPHKNVTLYQTENFGQIAIDSFSEQWKMDVLTQMTTTVKTGHLIDQKLCSTKLVQELLASNVKYDLLIHEGLFWMEAANIFQHKFNVPSVALLSVGDFFYVNEFAGLVNNPSFMVQPWTQSTDQMGFVERLWNTIALQKTLYFYYNHLRDVQRLVDRCYVYPGSNSRPPMTQILSEQSLILVNSHPSVLYAFPKPPHLKEIGGSVLQAKKPLSQELNEFMNGSKDGVIYFSMGTLFNMSAFPHFKDVFSRVFSTRKERVLWKWNGERWDGLPGNVMLSKWFPQQDILDHENVKLFITHGGLQSAFEAVHSGVPVIAIPAFTDQERNAMALAQRGYGLMLRLDNITDETLNWSLDETLQQPKYKERILRGSAALRDRPMEPVDEGVYWIEYVLRHGDVLRPQGTRLTFIQFHCWDVCAFLVGTLVIPVYLAKFLWTKKGSTGI